ncbi:MAG: hypothetical protein PHQ27_03275 [Victivallales bacterium]|nr:hypothetical protein [Victivallales bacterium]
MVDSNENNNIRADLPIWGPIDLNIFKLDLRVFLISLFRKWWLLPILPLTIAIVSLCYLAVYNPKAWVSQCLLFRHTNLQMLNNETIPNIYKPVNMNAIMEMVRTRKNMREVIKRLKLPVSLNGLYAMTRVSAEDDNENMITISAAASTPQYAADIANTLADVFIENYVGMQGHSVKEVYDYYLKSRKMIQDNLKKLENQEQEYLSKYKVISVSSEMSSKFSQLNELEVKLLQARLEQAASKDRIASINGYVEKMNPEVPISYEVWSPEGADLNAMKKELLQLQQKFTNDNPRVLKVKNEVALLQAEIDRNAGKRPAPTKVYYGENPVRSALEQLKYKTFSDLSGMGNNIQQIKGAIDNLRDDLERLSRLESKFYEVKTQLQLERDQFLKVDSMISALSLALKTNVSDINILERAEPPLTPDVKHRRIKIMISTILAFLLSVAGVLLWELFDFTVKSPFDLVTVLGLRQLGTFPKVSRISVKDFKCLVQIIFQRLQEVIGDTERTVLLAVGGTETKAGKSFLIERLQTILQFQKKRSLHIVTSRHHLPPDAVVINPIIYDQAEFDASEAARQQHQVYFQLTDQTFLVPTDWAMIEHFMAKMQPHYDYVIWELFDFDDNRQLFASVAGAATIAILVARFRQSPKLALLRCIHFLRERHVTRLYGVLNGVDSPYYQPES